MRRKGRECALQLLYQMDMQSLLDGRGLSEPALVEAIEQFWKSFEPVEDADRAFAMRLVRGVIEEREHLDQRIGKTSHRWKVERMSQVDRNILRLAAFELVYCHDIPRKVSINEAMEIAKRFSEGSSTGFINGILDHLEISDGDDAS